MKIHLITVVWGGEFIDFFLNVAIPNQLSKGNLEVFRDNPDAIYKIYTTSKDSEILENSSSFLELSKILKYEIIKIDDIDFSKKHFAMNQYHSHAIDCAAKEQAVIIFLSPDAIFSEFFFNNLMRLQENYSVVLTVGFRLIKEEITPILKEKFSNFNTQKISIPSRELVKLSMHHMHPLSKAQYIDAQNFGWGISHLYWKVENTGILIRALHLHPLLVKPKNNNKPVNDTIDGTYIEKTCNNYNDILIITDSDDLFCISVDSIDNPGSFSKKGFDLNRSVRWMCFSTNEYHRKYIFKKIRIHSEDISESWKKVEFESDILVNRIMTEYTKIKESVKREQKIYCFCIKTKNFIYGHVLNEQNRKKLRKFISQFINIFVEPYVFKAARVFLSKYELEKYNNITAKICNILRLYI